MDLKLRVKRRIHWEQWYRHSQDALLMDNVLECCPCVTRGIYDCDCELQDFHAWNNDITYTRKFTPPPVRPVNKNGAMVIDQYGLVRGPYLYEHWREYSFYLLDYFHDIIEGNDIPEWHRLYFRHEDDFYSGIYSHFYEMHFIMSHTMAGKVIKHSALNDIHRGVDMYENLMPAQIIKPSNFRGKGQMLTLQVPHYENCKDIWHINPRYINFERIQKKLIKRATRLKKRVNKMKKFNKKFKHRTMFYLPKHFQNFEKWYPKTKYVPIFYNYKTHQVQWPYFDTDPDLEDLHQDYIKDTIEKWLVTKAIYITRSADQIDLITPLVMANLPTLNGPPPDPDKKPRMCHDGGYEKEIEGHPIPCKMEDLQMVLPHIEQNDYLTKLDDKRGFHLVKMNRESRGLTAFRFRNKVFTYRVVPFGCPKSPAAFQRANAIAMTYGRTFGVRSNLYMDDRLCMDNEESIINNVPKNCFMTSMLCIASGSFLSIAKSDFEPKKVQEFLGLQLDTHACEISVPINKWKKFVTLVSTALEHKQCSFQTLECIRGKAVSFILTNPMTKLFIRQMNDTIKNALKDPNWKTSMIIPLTHKLFLELSEWIKLDFLQMRHTWWPTLNTDQRPYKVTFTDSSLFAIGVKIQHNNKVYAYTEYFNERDQQRPICQKEAIAIIKMLRKFRKYLQNSILVHFCDNTNVVYAYNGLGTKNVALNNLITEIYILLREMNSTIKMYWCSTTLQMADEPSRKINYNEEFIPWQRFSDLCNELKIYPTVDLMATSANTKAQRYISWGKTYRISEEITTCIGCDFFAQNPAGLIRETLYIFPPKPITSKVAQHLYKYYRRHKILMIFHAFMEIPLGIERLINIGATLHKWDNEKISIVPCENMLEHNNIKYAGKWNVKSKTTYILLLNLEN